MDRSWKWKLLRLAPLVASAALAGCPDRSDAPPAAQIAAAPPRDAWAISDIGIVYRQPSLEALPVERDSPADPPRATYEPRVLREYTLPDYDAVLATSKIEPLRVPKIDLSEALAAMIRRAAPPEITEPEELPPQIERLPLGADETIAPVVIARLPEVIDEPTASREAAAPPPAGDSILRVPQFAAELPSAAEPPLPSVKEIPLPAPHDMAMRAVQSRAEAQIHHAFGLARRGAHYSAKAELIEALRTITQALDMRDGATEHSDALARAFRTLDEAGDFQPRGAGLESNLELDMLVAGHRTPVLKDADLTSVTPLAALQRYYTYAQQQFTAAGGQQPAASAALYGLGRLQTIMGGPSVGGLNDSAPQAMVFHQAAVMVDAENYKSANELGVLLARYGQYDAARELLVHSVRVSPQAQSWQNLATVHAQLGESDLARRARDEARQAATGNHGEADADSPVRWVPSETLARSAPQSEDAIISPASSRAVSPAEPQTSEVRGIMKFLPWSRGE